MLDHSHAPIRASSLSNSLGAAVLQKKDGCEATEWPARALPLGRVYEW